MVTAIYGIMFKKAPHKIVMYNYASYMKEHFTSISKSNKCIHKEDEDDDKYQNIVIENTFLNLRKNLADNRIEYYEHRYEGLPIIFTENEDIVIAHMNFVVFSQNDFLPKWFTDSIVFQDEDVNVYDYLVYDKDGFDTISLEIKNTNIDLDLNYNDDLPDEQIKSFLMSDDSGLIVMNGPCGTGKSSYIRHLISTIDRDFIYMDQSAFDSITDASFMRTLAEYENSVLILEDCESMIVGRMDGNSKITTLLNLTDGIIGDSFKFKVICTFNANIGKIDQALLRKGRLKVKYEFKPLTVEKTQALAKSIGVKVPKNKEMTLADIYNVDYNGVIQEEKQIGFI